MSAWNPASLIANREFPTAFQPACLKHELSVFCRHARQEAMFTAARNPLRLPRSLGHESTNPLKTKIRRATLYGHTKSVELAPRPRRSWSYRLMGDAHRILYEVVSTPSNVCASLRHRRSRRSLRGSGFAAAKGVVSVQRRLRKVDAGAVDRVAVRPSIVAAVAHLEHNQREELLIADVDMLQEEDVVG